MTDMQIFNFVAAFYSPVAMNEGKQTKQSKSLTVEVWHSISTIAVFRHRTTMSFKKGCNFASSRDFSKFQTASKYCDCRKSEKNVN